MLLSYPLTSSNIFLHHSTIGDSVLQEKLTFWNVHFIFFQYGKAGSAKEEWAAVASFPLGPKPWGGIQEESRWRMTLSGLIRSLWQQITQGTPLTHKAEQSWPPLELGICLQSGGSYVTPLWPKDQPQNCTQVQVADLIVSKSLPVTWST